VDLCGRIYNVRSLLTEDGNGLNVELPLCVRTRQLFHRYCTLPLTSAVSCQIMMLKLVVLDLGK
jgi:uncharacterized metal-binding protein